MPANDCTCEETETQRLCPACTEAYVRWNVEEVYAQRPVEAFEIGLRLALERKEAA